MWDSRSDEIPLEVLGTFGGGCEVNASLEFAVLAVVLGVVIVEVVCDGVTVFWGKAEVLLTL